VNNIFSQNISANTDCTDLFFSELTFGKQTNTFNIQELNYAVEIYNSSSSQINLASYSLELETGTNTSISIPLSGTINSNDVFVISNSSANNNLQVLADQLSSNLNFDSYITLVLKKGNIILDRIGEKTSANMAGSFIQFLSDPYNYFSTFDLNLDDYNNIDIRRSHFVQHGEPVFNLQSVVSNWAYYINSDISNIGSHTSSCYPLANIITAGLIPPTFSANTPNIVECDNSNAFYVVIFDKDANVAPSITCRAKYTIVGSSLPPGNLTWGSGNAVELIATQNVQYAVETILPNSPNILNVEQLLPKQINGHHMGYKINDFYTYAGQSGMLTLTQIQDQYGNSNCPSYLIDASRSATSFIVNPKCTPTFVKDINYNLEISNQNNTIKISNITGLRLIEVFDLQGKCLTKFKGNCESLNLQNLPASIYLMKFSFENGTTKTKSISIN
jgi:hypothetical protein